MRTQDKKPVIPQGTWRVIHSSVETNGLTVWAGSDCEALSLQHISVLSHSDVMIRERKGRGHGTL